MITYLVTGGCGFIGANLILKLLAQPGARVVNLDALTYAGNPANLAAIATHPDYRFVHGGIEDFALVADLLSEEKPQAILHLAAESHVDRSIAGSDAFIRTNILGTHQLLEATRVYWSSLPDTERLDFRFLQVSTDEVFGSLGFDDPAFREDTPFAPNSPYSASKAASDHLVRAWHKTYGLPVLTTHCSNNYGPFQFPEKLIPLMIARALAGQPLPVYGDGRNVRDWLHVSDHCAALIAVLSRATPGSSYNIGGGAEMSNLDLVHQLCDLLDELRPAAVPRRRLVNFVKDRPGHDLRYAIDEHRIRTDIGWHPEVNFQSGLRHTLEWYLAHQDWVQSVTSGDYRNWLELNYAGRSQA